MADLRTLAPTKLASVSVTFSAAATATLYTVPSGKSLIPIAIVLHSPTASLSGGTCTFGQSGTANDFLTTQTLSNINGTTKAGILQPIPAATPSAVVKYVAGTVFVISVTATVNQSAVCDVYGILI